jgi:imidazolonepropionase-like amidohydrolase
MSTRSAVLLAITVVCLLAGCANGKQLTATVPSLGASPYPASAGTALDVEMGTVAGRLHLQGGSAPATDGWALHLFLENIETEEVLVVPVSPQDHTFEATVPTGRYYAYTWLPDLTLMGTNSSVESGSALDAHSGEPIVVAAGRATACVVVDDWHVPERPPLVLTGRLIDGTGADPLPDAVLVILGDRIVAVGPRSEVTIPSEAEVIELSEATMLPGFINAHVHNTYNPRNLQIWAQAGVTTVRDLGERPSVPWFSLRDKLCADPHNARIIAAGPLVTVPNGYPIRGNNFPALTITSPEDAREKISQLIDDGADVIKITMTSAPTLSDEEAAAIVQTAHERGVPVTVHATSAVHVKRALDAGVDDIAHIATDRVSDELIQRMVEAGVCWVPTFEALEGRGLDNLRRFISAGGRVALGNDSGYLQGLEMGMPTREMQWMRKAGMTPMQIIVAATRDAAYVCRRASTIGTLEVGKLADVLVVNGDPLRDLRALTGVRLVVHSGVVIRDER